MKISFLIAKIVVVFALIIDNQALAVHPVLPIYKGASQPDACSLDEQRGEKYARLLAISAKVSSSEGSGSGTVCYFDQESGWAYVVSCGHLWSGDKKYEPSSKVKAKIILWYKAGVKLESPVAYEAESLFWSNKRGYDVSLLRFKPDWPISYAPISSHFSPSKGDSLHSVGCDGGREVARYEVKFASFSNPDILTNLNSPRPGRSGGGLFDENEFLVGICWGTSDTVSGNGIGYFTPVDAIRKVFVENGHAWLLELPADAKCLPILDHDDPNSKISHHFIPMPRLKLER